MSRSFLLTNLRHFTLTQVIHLFRDFLLSSSPLIHPRNVSTTKKKSAKLCVCVCVYIKGTYSLEIHIYF